MRCCLSVCFGFPHYTVGFRFCTSANVLQQLKAAFWHLIGGPLSLATPVGRSYKYQWWCPDSAREETASFAYRSWHRRRAPYIEAYKKSRGGGAADCDGYKILLQDRGFFESWSELIIEVFVCHETVIPVTSFTRSCQKWSTYLWQRCIQLYLDRWLTMLLAFMLFWWWPIAGACVFSL